MGVGVLESVQEEDNLEDVHDSLLAYQEKLKRQIKISFAWKTRYRNECLLVAKMKKEKEKCLESIQSQLFLFESHLVRGRSEFESVLKQKDKIVQRQHQLICSLVLSLIKKDGHDELRKILPGLKLERKNSELKSDSECVKNLKNEKTNNENKEKFISPNKTELENLNDSDSAIMMEDAYDSLITLPSTKGEVKVMRSVSDALEIISRGITSSVNNKPNPTNQARRHGHGSLSSTPSCSSEDSDDSPSSTISKNQSQTINDGVMSESLLRLDKICMGLAPSAFIPYKSQNFGDFNNHSSYSSDRSETKIHCCSRDVCESPSCWQGFSSSTTPVASPINTPTISPISSPTNLRNIDLSSSPFSSSHENCEYDSDVTLSDGQNDENDGCKEILVLNTPKAVLRRKDSNVLRELSSFLSSTLNNTSKNETIQVTYNRVMSNHRSVTKPKDVKYKRINKAKSRSLEELRGKLKLSDGKQSNSGDLNHTSEA